MSKTMSKRKVSSRHKIRQSSITHAVRQTLRGPHPCRRSMLTLAAAGLLAISTPALAAFPAALNLADLDGSNGFVMNGIAAGDLSGGSVSDVGDINGDGIDDVIIGAVHAGPVASGSSQAAGEAYVVFGTKAGLPAALNLTDLDGSNGFVIRGINVDPISGSDLAGDSVSAAGDVNGDGIDDVIIGADFANPNGIEWAGESYVVFGRTTGFPAVMNLSGLDGSNGFVINGFNANEHSGNSVSAAGDVNGDGIDDVIIGGVKYDRFDPRARGGTAYVVFGRTSGFPAAVNLSGLDGSIGFSLGGVVRGGFKVSATAVDINGDGIDDVVIGAALPEHDYVPPFPRSENYVVFGRATGFPASFDLSGLDGSNGFVIINSIGGVSEAVGWNVSGAGDINGDGIDDMIFGDAHAAPGGRFAAGKGYVVFGRVSGFPAALNLAGLDGSNGFVMNGVDASDRTGRSVSAAGDVNDDGFADVIIGATGEGSVNPAGKSYVVFGRKAGFPAALNLSDLDGRNGFVMNGIDAGDRSGGSVSAAGDVNHDGIADVIIGAGLADPLGNNNAGESYVVFGQVATVPIFSPSLLPLGDINADSRPDIAALVHDVEANALIAHVKAARDGSSISDIKFNPFYTPIHFKSMADVTTNSAPELVVVGKRHDSGMVRAAVRDSLNGKLVNQIFYNPNYIPEQLSIVPDMNGNGAEELALLVKDVSKNRLKVVVRDGMNGKWLRAFNFNNNYQPQDMLVLPDRNGNGVSELAVLATAKFALGADRVEIRDLKSGQLLKIIGISGVFNPEQMELLSDRNGNGYPELGIMLTGSSRAQVRDGKTGNLLKNIWYNRKYQDIKMVAVPDINGGGAEELGVLGRYQTKNLMRAMLKDSQSAVFISNVWFDPATNVHDLDVIDDFSGNAISELVLLGTRKGRLQAIIKDAKTGKYISSFFIP